jgi:hypothetical protein
LFNAIPFLLLPSKGRKEGWKEGRRKGRKYTDSRPPENHSE